ncbi:hypothetical protein ElyMa_005319400 [Elysia marginata]|uniref:Uncharacterized protein n=1 Tax=Elysia marginata TaxID=1093978 RepID=A0AAV4K0X8_9GAST|nr:hypothetical protein ElyMa_005319400 [Elysia marginata]
MFVINLHLCWNERKEYRGAINVPDEAFEDVVPGVSHRYGAEEITGRERHQLDSALIFFNVGTETTMNTYMFAVPDISCPSQTSRPHFTRKSEMRDQVVTGRAPDGYDKTDLKFLFLWYLSWKPNDIIPLAVDRREFTDIQCWLRSLNFRRKTTTKCYPWDQTEDFHKKKV